MRERLVDAGLAAGGLVAVLAAAVAAGVEGHPTALAAGVASALVAEFLLQRRQAAVRRAWARPRTKVAAAGTFVVVLVLSAAVAPAPALSLLAGGLLGYLALLAGIAVGDAVRES